MLSLLRRIVRFSVTIVVKLRIRKDYPPNHGNGGS